jgi:inorganic pyrophosphatase/exopolyphosphatase
MKSSEEIIITSGSAYTDIDVFACAIAYKKLCDYKGVDAKIVLPGELNESVSTSIRHLEVTFLKEFKDSENVKYVVVDVSDPAYFPNFINQKRILEVYDHHWGYETYWKSKIGKGAKIEFVGSCATLVYEEFLKEQLDSQIDKTTALLLYTAILSNTLNLHAQITTERDREALKKLSKDIHEQWGEKYFNEVTASILKNPDKAMLLDTKTVILRGKEYSMIQIELWNSKKFISDFHHNIISRLESANTPYVFFTSPSISEGKNYLVARNDKIKKLLKKCIGANFKDDIGHTSKLWLRKEIIKELGKLRL